MTASLYYNMELIFHEFHKETSKLKKVLWRILFWWCLRYKVFSLYKKAFKQKETHMFRIGRAEAKCEINNLRRKTINI